jgi:hypothetical protein
VGGTEGVRSRFHVLRSRTRFRWKRGRTVPFSCFSLPDMFSAVPRASGIVFMFCALVLIFAGIEGVRSRFHVLWSRTRFRWCRVRRVPFSCIARPDSFSTVPRVPSPVFKFCAPGLIFGGIEGVGSRFHVLRPRTHFRRCRVRRVPFLCFARPYSFSAVPRSSGLVFMFCAPGLVFDGAECVGSRFHVLCARTRFRLYRGRRVPFSCFARPDSFSAVPRASGPVFMSYAPELVFGGTEVVGSRFHVLCARTRFQLYRVRRIPFSYFARPDSFSAVLRASGPIFMFCTPRLVFGSTEGIRSYFHVLRSYTRFQLYQGRQVPFSCFALPDTHFRRYRGRPILFSCFLLPDMFLAVPRVSGPVLMFCAP